MNDNLMSESALKNRLLVEGPDDVNFCFHLFRLNNIDADKNTRNKDVDIKDKGSVEKVLRSLDVELRATDYKSLGVLVDADEKLQSHWQSISQTLQTYGYTTVPKEPVVEGTIIREEDKKPVGIWIMPNNRLPGMLEDFCRFLIP